MCAVFPETVNPVNVPTAVIFVWLALALFNVPYSVAPALPIVAALIDVATNVLAVTDVNAAVLGVALPIAVFCRPPVNAAEPPPCNVAMPRPFNVAVPLTASIFVYTVPPTLTFPVTPTPPCAIIAPVVVLVLATPELATKLPATTSTPITVSVVV